MIYVPMLKGRTEEFRVVEKLNFCFSEQIIPLIEILTEEFEMRYKIDPLTNDYVWKDCEKARRREKEKVREITLYREIKWEESVY